MRADPEDNPQTGTSDVKARGDASVAWIVLMVLLVGAAYSVRWIYPLIHQSGSHGQYVFVPLLIGPCDEKSTNDQYFYYARVRDVLDGRVVSFDPISYENRDRITPHSTYLGSFIMSSVGALLTGRTEHAYYFNCFVYPALGFLLTFVFINRLTGRRDLSSLLAAVAFFTGMFHIWSKFRDLADPDFLPLVLRGATDFLELTQIPRMPALLFTHVHLMVFINLLFSALVLESRSKLLWAGLTFTLGVSSLVSSTNLLLCYSIAGFALLMGRPGLPWKDGPRRALFCSMAAAVLISLPGVWLSFQAYRVLAEWTLMTGVIFGLTMERVLAAARIAVYLAIPLFAVALIRPRHARFLAAVLIAILVAFVFLSVSEGYNAGLRILFRGAEILVGAILIATLCQGVFKVMHRYRRSRELADRWGPFASKAALLLAALIPFMAIWNQFRVVEEDLPSLNRPDFKALCDWSRKAMTPDTVVVTMDADLLINMPVYSPASLYLPQAVQSATPEKERFLRWYETARLYGLTAREMAALLDRLVCYYYVRSMRDKGLVQDALLQRVLTYDLHREDELTQAEKDRIIEAYKAVLDSGAGLSFKADYLIVSEHDLELIQPGSAAARIMTETPVFRNASYAVYRLPKGIAAPARP